MASKVVDGLKNFFGIPTSMKAALSPSTSAAASIMKPTANYTQGVDAQFENLVRFGWRRNEVIFACITKTAKTASQVELKVYDDASGKELADHDLKKLIQRPNPQMSEYDLWSSVISFQKLAGIAYFEKERDNAGRVIHLWPLRPDWVKPRMASAIEVAYYRYQPSGSSDYVDLQPSNIIAFKLWDPMGLYSYWPPAAVAARAGEIDNETTDMIKAFIQEGGLPIGLLSAQGRLRDEQIDELRARWRIRYGGWKNWIDPAVLDNGATYQRMGLTFEEMGFEGLDSRNETRICMALDVPPILVSAKSGLDRATYSNYKEAREAWWEDSLIPLYTDFLDVLINQLQNDFDDADRITLKWDFSRVPVMQEQQQLVRDQAVKELAAGGITVNEFRIATGHSNIGPDGDIFLRQSSVVVVPGKPTAAKSNGHSHDHVDGFVNELKGVTTSPDPDRMDMEEQLTKELIKYFKQQEKLIEKEITSA